MVPVGNPGRLAVSTQIFQNPQIIFSCIMEALAIPLVSDYNGYNDVLTGL